MEVSHGSFWLAEHAVPVGARPCFAWGVSKPPTTMEVAASPFPKLPVPASEACRFVDEATGASVVGQMTCGSNEGCFKSVAEGGVQAYACRGAPKKIAGTVLGSLSLVMFVTIICLLIVRSVAV